MAEAWRTDWERPHQSLLDLRLDDEAYKLAAQAKVRAGYALTDEELLRLLRCELAPERELELNRLADGMEADWQAYRSWKRKRTIWAFAVAAFLLMVVSYAVAYMG